MLGWHLNNLPGQRACLCMSNGVYPRCLGWPCSHLLSIYRRWCCDLRSRYYKTSSRVRSQIPALRNNTEWSGVCIGRSRNVYYLRFITYSHASVLAIAVLVVETREQRNMWLKGRMPEVRRGDERRGRKLWRRHLLRMLHPISVSNSPHSVSIPVLGDLQEMRYVLTTRSRQTGSYLDSWGTNTLGYVEIPTVILHDIGFRSLVTHWSSTTLKRVCILW